MVARLPADLRVRIYYEDLCRDPDGTLARIFRFLHLDPALANRDFHAVEHHILGNYMRLNSTGEITLDEKWKTALTPPDLAAFERIAGSLNRRYRYE